MSILVVMHVDTEGPGTLADYLESGGLGFDYLKLYEGESFPRDPAGFSGIVVMGGPMNVYEEDRYPFLREETLFLREAVHADVPVLGICLGAQMIAKALGAKVRKSPRDEIGWYQVSLTEDGIGDPFFRGAPPKFKVLQWHRDAFDIPERATRLAGSNRCRNQAFRFRRAVGIQFHIEANHAILFDWTRDLKKGNRILEEFEEFNPVLSEIALKMYANFFHQVRK